MLLGAATVVVGTVVAYQFFSNNSGKKVEEEKIEGEQIEVQKLETESKEGTKEVTPQFGELEEDIRKPDGLDHDIFEHVGDLERDADGNITWQQFKKIIYVG